MCIIRYRVFIFKSGACGRTFFISVGLFYSWTVLHVLFCRLLEHFNTSQEEYTLIFTANCTAALKTIAECFSFSQPLRDGDEANEALSQMKNSQSGCFCYLLDNHTSVQGMRECLHDRTSAILCLPESELYNKDVSKSFILAQQNSYNAGNCLFVYPAQSNFSGRKYPLSWIEAIRNQELGFQNQFTGNWFTVLDAAALVSTSPLDLGVHKPDFVTLSFYKMFGFPTGLGKHPSINYNQIKFPMIITCMLIVFTLWHRQYK